MYSTRVIKLTRHYNYGNRAKNNNDMLQGTLQDLVEDVCKLGCIRVNEIIALLEQGKNIPDIPDLNQPETEMLLSELKAIMAVYEVPD